MRWLLVTIACIAVSAALAQTPEGEDSGLQPGERQCITAEEAQQATGPESGPSGEGGPNTGDDALPICDEPGAQVQAGTPPEEPAPGDSGDPGAEDEMDDDMADEDYGREFEPEDEISEDYPVPLPSDI